jgi:hypothetical protein
VNRSIWSVRLRRIACAMCAVLAAFMCMQPVAAYDSPYWLAEYFPNPTLSGSPALLQTVGAIAFNWGRGSPGTGLPVDGFSARWSRPTEFVQGVYRISTRVDDGVRIYIDDRLVLDEWRDGPSRTADVDVALGGAHLLRVEYYERSDVASVSVTIERIDVPTSASSAWRAEYFNNPSLSGVPALVREEDGRSMNGLNFDFGVGSPDPRIAQDGFSARWSRRVDLVAGYYRVAARIDDGVRVYVGDRLVIDDWRDGALRVIESQPLFLAGDVPLRIEYYERTGAAAVRVDISPAASVTPPPVPTPLSPRTFTRWRGEYFAGSGLSGAPVIVRNDNAIDFDWGQGAPENGVPADEFSVRWTRRLRFSPGSYRFSVRVDDGARLYIDGRLLIDAWREGAPRTVTADVSLPGSVEVRLEYFDRTGGALVQLSYQRIDRSFPDWRAEYFDNPFLQGEPSLTRNDRVVSFDWGSGAPAPWLPMNDFSVRWTRTQTFAAGWQRFSLTVDDGMRVYLDGALLIDQWRDGAVRSLERVVWVDAGRHELRVEYYERAGGASAGFAFTPSTAPPPTLAP